MGNESPTHGVPAALREPAATRSVRSGPVRAYLGSAACREGVKRTPDGVTTNEDGLVFIFSVSSLCVRRHDTRTTTVDYWPGVGGAACQFVGSLPLWVALVTIRWRASPWPSSVAAGQGVVSL